MAQKLEVGQEVFLLRIRDGARGKEPEDLIVKDKIVKVGRKYFCLEIFRLDACSLKTMEDASLSYKGNYIHVFLSLQELEDYQKANKLWYEIRVFFDDGNRKLELKQLEEISLIINDSKEFE